MHIVFVAIISIILSVAAQFLLKAGILTLYGLGAVVWLKVLSTWDVSKAYPLVGLGFGLTVLVGMAMGESVTALRVLGVLLICEGVWLVANS
jgi:uncharacterized membrane protein